MAIALAAATPATAAPQAGGAPQAGAPAAPAGDTGSMPPLTGPRVQQDTFTAADEAPGSRNVNVSFDNNFIADRLPFDVPFNVTGNVDTAVRRLELSVYRVSSDVDLAQLIGYLQTTVDCVGQKPPGMRVSFSAVTPGNTGRYSLFVNALDPQYYYALCFVGVTPVPTAEIQADVRRAIAAVVPRLDTGEDISLALLADIRGAMSKRIADIGAGRPVRASIPEGNLFDARPNDPRFTPLAGAIAKPIIAMPFQVKNYQTAIQGLGAALEKAQGTVPLTPELLDSLPSPETPLPTPESAITGDRDFDGNAYSFDAAKKLLATMLADANLKGAVGTLNELVRLVNDAERAARAYGIEYDRLRGATAALMTFVALEARAVNVTLGSSVLSADLARSAYVSLDAGVAYPWRLETMVFYAGTNIYFRPINKAAPLRYKGTFLHRFALTVGITTTVNDESRRAQDLRNTPDVEDTSNSLLLGAGLRVTPSMRVGGGVLVFKEIDPNPLVDQTSVAVTPYVSFTADVDVAAIFRSFF